MKHIKKIVLYCLLNLFHISANATPRDIGEGLTSDSNSKALKNSNNHYGLWSGIGRVINSSGERCTAALIDTRNKKGNSIGPAYLITSGHCVFAEYGTARINENVEANVTFNYFYDTPEQHKTYKIRKAAWSSMVGKDLAILEVDASLATLIQDWIMPLKLSAFTPAGSHDIVNVGAPAGFSEKGLRLTACPQEPSVTIIEQPGVFPGVFKNQCKDLLPGSSGSPMLDRRSNQIVSIYSKSGLTTDWERSDSRHARKTIKTNYSYPASFLHTCFVEGFFKPDTESCTLQPVNVTNETPWLEKTYVSLQTDAAGKSALPTWQYRFSIDTSYYRYKVTREATGCQDSQHYSAAISSDAAFIDSQIGPETGMHVMCIIGVASQEQKLTSGLLQNAFATAVHLTEPAPMPNISLGADGSHKLSWEDSHPEFAYHFFHSGAADTLQCGDIDDERYKQVFHGITIASEIPIKLCSYARNREGQPSAVRIDLLTLP